MRKIAVIFGMVGVILSHQLFAENRTEQFDVSQSTFYKVGPGKNYRSNLAKQYFGGSSKCRKWKRFCGR
ncbi:MAG: hypothetical protein QXF12_00765 [Candidatus Aenigmatarchaeota archaeon]